MMRGRAEIAVALAEGQYGYMLERSRDEMHAG